jgi:hypothetical protein
VTFRRVGLGGVMVKAFGRVTTSVPALTVMLRCPGAVVSWMGRVTTRLVSDSTTKRLIGTPIPGSTVTVGVLCIQCVDDPVSVTAVAIPCSRVVGEALTIVAEAATGGGVVVPGGFCAPPLGGFVLDGGGVLPPVVVPPVTGGVVAPVGFVGGALDPGCCCCGKADGGNGGADPRPSDHVQVTMACASGGHSGPNCV